MADDSDLARLLPDSPPPRPAARDAAIAAAMRRFDGVPDPAPAVAPDRRPARWVSGKQIGAFASIILVAGISLSIALNRPDGLQPGRVATPPADTAPRSAPALDRPGAPKPPATSAAEGPTPAAKLEPPIQKPVAPAVPVTLASGADRRAAEDQAPAASPPPPPPPAPPAAMAPPLARFAPQSAAPPAADESPIVAGRRAQSKITESASPTAVASRTADEGSDSNQIVVTGARARRPNAYAARGDWNACTVIDPQESLRGCKGLIGIGAKGPAGEAAGRLSDGLALAWRGDLDGAIAAFDQAIALKPKFAFAYLNRGLAYQREGNAARAAADLDLAIKYAPYAARGYYNRSVLRREQGNRRGADADANRAVQLDPDYPDPTS
ncbi:tetratricopeptide repeat protein [Sphingomonas mali]|uniref:tetratricopeptide repeat protein n=1 Tax=Sphingomonas mali TaxID=40682 RepID=UPI000831D1C5|nr:tetratricopeptide repeat protein [Sphingomonas mali]